MPIYYRFVIRDKKFSGYKKIASLLFAVNAVVFIAFAIARQSISSQLILFAGSSILLVYSFYHWKYKQKGEKSYIIIYLLTATIWLIETPYYFFPILFLVLLFFQYKMERDVVISFSDTVVTINRLTNLDYQWSAFNNIVLKDGLLTLDFVNNKIIQEEPDWTEPLLFAQYNENEPEPYSHSDVIGEDYPRLELEFNDFCSRQIQSVTSAI